MTKICNNFFIPNIGILCLSFLFYFSDWARSLSILLLFPKKQLWFPCDFFCCFSISLCVCVGGLFSKLEALVVDPY